MKEMNQEAKDGLNQVIQKIEKDIQSKRKQAEELYASAKALETSAKALEENLQKWTKEIETINVAQVNNNDQPE